VFACSSSSSIGDIPPPPDAGATTNADVSTLAITKLFIGDTDVVSAAASTLAWKRIGYDLDGQTTTADSTSVCIPASSFSSAKVDGVDGIDNAFGSLLVPLLQADLFDLNASDTASTAIAAGKTTTLLRIVGLTDSTQTATGLAATASMGATITSGIANASTTWPSIAGTTVTFGTVYVVDGTTVARDADTTLPLAIWATLSVPLTLAIHHPIITLRRDGTSPVRGVIAGTLDTSEAIAAFQALAGRFSQSLCGSAFDGVVAQIRDMQDIMLDETNPPGAPCNAISIGIAFTATQIANAQTTVDVPSPPDPCTDAGTD